MLISRVKVSKADSFLQPNVKNVKRSALGTPLYV